MKLRKMIFGEPMPDKDDPKYKERFKKGEEAGAKFARKIGLSKGLYKLQLWTNDHKVAFLVITFGFVLCCLALNIAGMIYQYKNQKEGHRGTAVEMVDQALKEQRLKNR